MALGSGRFRLLYDCQRALSIGDIQVALPVHVYADLPAARRTLGGDWAAPPRGPQAVLGNPPVAVKRVHSQEAALRAHCHRLR